MPFIELEKSAGKACVFVSLFFRFAGSGNFILDGFSLRSLFGVQVELLAGVMSSVETLG